MRYDMHHDELKKLVLSTPDGKVTIFWIVISIVLGVLDIYLAGATLNSGRFLFYPIILILIFLRFRVGVDANTERTNLWGLINVCAFGGLVLYLEVIK